MGTRKRFTPEFKREAVQLLESGSVTVAFSTHARHHAAVREEFESQDSGA